ncbi:AAA domain-containing protein [Streptosporangium sp. CA-115845]|uniref:AAA domain-containing protein n=1 Tax=Streptosporangium sp. CA-115845 TaxID=3240071 RepID=UPI003D8BBF5B
MPEQIKDRYYLIKGSRRTGGLAEVQRAVDIEAEGSQVAIKFIRGVPDERITHQLFQRETEALRAVHHPNIVKLLDSGWDSGRESHYLVLEWLDDSFSDVLNKQGPYSWDNLSSSVAQPLAEALAHAHLKGVAHRDIKPQNVLFNSSGAPKLADFGIAKMQEKLIPPGLTVGDFRSEPYTPPGVDETSFPYARDVYSFAVLLIQALTKDTLRQHGDIQPALARIDVPPDIRRLLEECVNTDASQRPANGSVLAQRLNSIKEARAVRVDAGIIWLQLTKSAIRHVLGENALEDRQVAANLLQRDLSRGGSAEFKFDSANQRHDKQTIYLTGHDYQITLKRNQTEPALVVVGVRKCEEEWRDKAQRVALSLGRSFSFQCSPPSDINKAQTGIDAFIDALEEHKLARQEARLVAQNRQEQNELFNKWLQVLDAREDLARGERRPLSYHGREVAKNGREVTFSLTESVSLDLLGQEWDVVIPESRRTLARGEVVRQEADYVTLSLRREGRNLPNRGQLVPYLEATKIALVRQQEAIEKIKNGTAARSDLRSLLLDPTTCVAPESFPIEDWQRSELDQSKRAAVSYALGSKDFLLIQGPPGTGKTSVITEIVAQLLRQNPEARVLIVSQTHVAVDNALERLDAAGIPGLVRLGRPEDPRVDPAVQHLLLDKAMERWAREIQKRAEDYLAEESKRLRIDKSYLRAALSLQQLANVLAEVDIVQRRVKALSNSAPSSDLATGLGLAEDMEATRDLLDRLFERKEELIKASRSDLAGALTIREAISQEEARDAVELLLDGESSARHLLQVLKLQADWMLRLTSDKHLANVFLKTANVVAGTCIGFLGHSAVRDLDFDLCILDEASKATATEALVPLARAHKWILVGDTRQLPPMDEELLRSKAKLEEYGLDPQFVSTTVFDYLIKETAFPIQQELVEQYRMIRPIGDLVSTCFYDEKLKSPIVDGIKGYDALWGPVSWIDTGCLGSERFQQEGPNGGIANRAEAALVVDRLKSIDTAIGLGAIKPPSGRKLNLLIIAPYRLQIDEIHRKFTGIKLQHLNVEIQSVDAVQGKEADFAIFSVTRSNPQGKLGFLGDKYWRRINVALSRARYGLTVIGDADFCRSSPGALQKVVNYMEEHPQDCKISEAERVRL